MPTFILSILLSFIPPVQTELHSIDNLMFVEVEVNDKAACFMVDSGSPATVLDSRQAKRYGFKAVGPEYKIGGLCGKHSWQAATGVQMEIANQPIFPVLATADLICMQRVYSKSLPAPLLGIMGNDVLKNYHAEFNLDASTLTFFFQSPEQDEQKLFSVRK